MSNHRVLLVLIGFLISLQLSAQSGGEVRGVVKGVSPEGKTERLAGAHVIWMKTSEGTATKVDGTFSMPLSEETDMLVIRFIGYQSDTVKYTGKPVKVTLQSGEMIEEALVVYEREATELSLIDPLNTQTMNRKELQKAACCNLSESFETNASVDASFTDAVTGTRQIEMLGLDGKYTQIMQDVVPSVRGLQSVYGLTYIPGDWIESIQVSKGMGSVVNGYESITGQINANTKSPDTEEKLHFNLYGNQGGRMEANANVRADVGEKWKTMVLAHGHINRTRRDMNDDGFLDNPLGETALFRNEWRFTGDNGWRGKYQLNYLSSGSQSGQFNFDPDDAVNRMLYGVVRNTERIQGFAKTGYVFDGQPWKSFGSQISGTFYDNESTFGNREYSGLQESFRINLLYSSMIGNTNHKFTTGVSYQQDGIRESLDSLNFDRTEQTPGAFFEYTWNNTEVFTLVAGMRADHSNFYGLMLSPRLHFRYSLSENTSAKLAAGRGWRTSNVIMENVGLLASSRNFFFEGNEAGNPYGMKAEEAWNYGVNLTHKFRLFYREGSLTLDYYRTDFENQVVTDLDESAGEVYFYNLENASYSNSAQVEVNYSPFRRVTLRMAYRWIDVRTKYRSGWKEKPLISEHRALANIGYETKEREDGKQWRFDVTGTFNGQMRLPKTSDNPVEYQLAGESEQFFIVNAQITRAFGKSFEVYLGGENLLNFQQENPIIANRDPFGEDFDASLVYGPIFGRMFYGGLRYTIR
jgi:outer membrane receptor for ferrienterochelin and colicin